MTKYITGIVVLVLLFCFSGKAYCWPLNDLKNAAQKAASEVTNNALTGTSNNNAANSLPSAAGLKEASTPADVQDDGVFYTAEAASSTEKRSGPLTVFDIPLNASVQEVFSVIEKKGMDFRYGCFNDENQMKRFSKEGLRDLVSRSYEAKGISGASKEAALRVVDEGKIKFYPFKYKGRQYGLRPQSLDALLNSDLKPVFDKYYSVYNSQFMIELRDLSEDMKSQGVTTAYILFGSFNQEEPRSYLINLGFRWGEPGLSSNPKLAAVLNKKYGLPKIYRCGGNPGDAGDTHNGGDRISQLDAVFAYFKSKGADYEEKEKNGLIYKIPEFLAINDAVVATQIARPLIIEGASKWNFYYGRSETCNFEWHQGDVKVIADFVVWPTSSQQLILEPDSLDYIYFPLAMKIADGIEEAVNASKQSSESEQKKAEESF